VLDGHGLKAEREARRTLGFEVDFLARHDLKERYGLHCPAALLSHGDFTVDPRRLTAGYLRAALANGARLHTPVEVTGADPHRGGIIVDTATGPTIRAHYAIFATGYEVPKFGPRDRHRIVSTYAIATRSQRRRLWPQEALIWEASDPYLYMRTTADGGVVRGGEDEDFSDDKARDALIGKKAAAIGRKLLHLFPQLDVTPEFAWAGAFGTTATGLPRIGRIPGRKNCWAVLGFGGNGITCSRIAADIIRVALAGKSDPDADLYAFR
jgi:glycine/D-amino acid oxidase-like deaminating enzyme